MLSFDLLLDGVSIADRITKVTIQYDRNATHNQISVESSDPDLYAEIDPDLNPGTARISVTLGDDTLLFLLERPINGTDGGCTFGGRSVSAQEEEEYAGTVWVELLDYQWNVTARRTSTVLAGMLTQRAFEFGFEEDDLDNSTWYLLNYTWSWGGSPIKGVEDVAPLMGAIVRSRDDGTIALSPKYPHGPKSLGFLESADIDLTLDANDDIIGEISFSEEAGQDYNAVLYRVTLAPDVPEIVVEEGGYETGDPANDTIYLRCYWGKDPLLVIPDTWTSDGTLSHMPSLSQQTESVVFSGGKGRVTYPVASLDSFSWTDGGGGEVSSVAGALYLDTDGDDGTASVTYTPEGYINNSEHLEEVTFQDGAASVAHNITTLNSVTWHGAEGGTVAWSQGEKDLRCEGQAGLAMVSYQAQYQRWRLTGCTEKNVLVAFSAPLSGNNLYKVSGTSGDRRAPDIERVSAGGGYGQGAPEVAIYDSYSRIRLSFQVPMDRQIRDNMIVHIQDYPSAGQYVRGYIDKVTMNIESVQMVYDLEVLIWPA